MKLFGRPVFVLIILVQLSFCKTCKNGNRLKLDGPVEFRDGALVQNDTVFLKNEFWKEGGDYYGCPCDRKSCIRLCHEDFVPKVADVMKKNITLPEEKYNIDIFHGDKLKTVNLHEHFNVIEGGECDEAFPLDPDEEESDKHVILANGSLHFTHLSDDEMKSVYRIEEYCILTDEDGKLLVLQCFFNDTGLGKQEGAMEFHFYLYPVFMICSVIFLFLTLLAFIVTPEMKNLHGKSIACQSFTLMMAYIGLTVTYLSGTDNHIIVCKTFAYIAFYFLLSSFYWLNTMCFDIFMTFGNFKKMTGSLQQTHKKKFRMYALYSTINPLIALMLVVILDHTVSHTSYFYPGIGFKSCWFRSHHQEFFFFQGPVLFLLFLNTMYFIVTLVKITKMKNEAAVLKRGDSMTHGGKGSGLEDRQRLALYVKLFLLMGGTWLMEVISWAAHSKPKWLWVPFDIINCSRGVLIFIFCVVTNVKVRNSLLRRYLPKYASHDISGTEQRSFHSKASATSDMSVTNDDPSAAVPLKNLRQDETSF
ncbi:G-protein coupled receptor Mth2-like [Neocloeon triangulifer]|uniref:G-protein coupled receptor Mth2-like n=1 Tax=Neocloeon triangulifer TaxID=2078957 RepID=UPI00286F3FE1|nr:G-protein coupled receptor Mth2-like [Neocloeon triangulifer]